MSGPMIHADALANMVWKIKDGLPVMSVTRIDDGLIEQAFSLAYAAGLRDGYEQANQVGRWHFSRFTVVPLSWLLDRVGQHSMCDDLDYWAEAHGWWHR